VAVSCILSFAHPQHRVVLNETENVPQIEHYQFMRLLVIWG